MTQHDTIRTALQALAKRTRAGNDGSGFSRYDAEFGLKLAELPGYTDRQAEVAVKMLNKYRAQLDALGVSVPTLTELSIARTVDRHVEQALAAVAPKPRLVKGYLSASPKGKKLIASFPYNPTLVQKCRAIKDKFGDTTYDGETKSWKFPKEAMDEVLKAFAEFEMDTTVAEMLAAREREREAEKKRELVKAERALEYQRVAGDLSKPFPSGIQLYKHQQDGIREILRRQHVILADDMGLGKTIQSLWAAHIMQQVTGASIFVIARPSLHDSAWRKDAAKLGVTVELFSNHMKKIPVPLQRKPYIVIADEAHDYQTLSAGRTEKMLELTDDPNCIAVILATGTPIKNGRPVNIFPLLKMVKHPLAKNKRQYEERFCAAGPGVRTAWDASGASHLDELHEELKPVMIRRLKKECLDLPEKTRIMREAELSPEATKLYNEKLRQLVENYRERLMRGEIKEGGEILVQMTQLRHSGSVGKAETAVELATEVVEEGRQCVIFTEFEASVEMISKQLEGYGISTVKLTGATPQKQRGEIVECFQRGDAKVFIGTVKAGGVGLTLTAADTVILVDRPWTPGDAFQAEDRAHRIGQANNVTVVWLQYGKIDDRVDEILLAKQKRIELVLEGKRKTLRGIESAADVAREIMNELAGIY